MGIVCENDIVTILNAATTLNNRVDKNNSDQVMSVDEWLRSIHLESYAETFRKHLYTDMDRVRRVWEVELAAVLEIQKPAHRKRILASVGGNSSKSQSQPVRNGRGPNLDDLNKDLNILVSSTKLKISNVKNQTWRGFIFQLMNCDLNESSKMDDKQFIGFSIDD